MYYYGSNSYCTFHLFFINTNKFKIFVWLNMIVQGNCDFYFTDDKKCVLHVLLTITTVIVVALFAFINAHWSRFTVFLNICLNLLILVLRWNLMHLDLLTAAGPVCNAGRFEMLIEWIFTFRAIVTFTLLMMKFLTVFPTCSSC